MPPDHKTRPVLKRVYDAYQALRPRTKAEQLDGIPNIVFAGMLVLFSVPAFLIVYGGVRQHQFYPGHVDVYTKTLMWMGLLVGLGALAGAACMPFRRQEYASGWHAFANGLVLCLFSWVIGLPFALPLLDVGEIDYRPLIAGRTPFPRRYGYEDLTVVDGHKPYVKGKVVIVNPEKGSLELGLQRSAWATSCPSYCCHWCVNTVLNTEEFLDLCGL